MGVTTGGGVSRGLAPKMNLIAIIAPTANDDITKGYTEGSVWVDNITNTAYTCVEDVQGGAIWTPQGGAAGAAQSAIQFSDEGVPLGTSGTATVVDFVGASVTASRTGNTLTVSIPTPALLLSHIADTANPHATTAAQVGLGNVDNTSDAAKPVSTATQTALNLKADTSALVAHTGDMANPHAVTKAQVGLGNADNTSDINKPISTATQTALNLKADITSLPSYVTATMNFGLVSARRATSSVDVTSLAGLTAASYIDAFPMAEATTDHSADGVRVDAVDYICQFLSPTSVRIFGASVRGHTYGNRTVRVVIK